jgi:hypothetical protein
MTAESSSEARKSSVFVSYLHDNQDVVDRLVKELSAYGIKVWIDRSDIKPGYLWQDAIREAISEGDFFVACFSEAYERRSETYMNEELTLATEELRQRPTERTWFIPVLLSECKVPAMSIGAGKTLENIQRVELYRDWEEGIAKIAAAIDPNAQIAQPPRVWQLDDSEWPRLIQELSDHICVPILGSGVNYGVVPADAILARKWAREHEEPEWIGRPFSEVFEHLVEHYGRAFFIKKVVEEYARAQFPELNLPGKPHAVLSRLPCKVFITTCIDRFMEDALTTQGKNPRSALVGPGNRNDPSPTVSEPLVFHVFGRIDVPESLVITAHDQMSLFQTEYRKVAPPDVGACVWNGSLVWLGFDLDSVEYRTVSSLFTGRRDLAYRDRVFLDREFERLAKAQGRRRILLREFMAELQSRWEQMGSKV